MSPMARINGGDDLEKTGTVSRGRIHLCSHNLFHMARSLSCYVCLAATCSSVAAEFSTREAFFSPPKGFMGEFSFSWIQKEVGRNRWPCARSILETLTLET